jgi:hypothetical protein
VYTGDLKNLLNGEEPAAMFRRPFHHSSLQLIGRVSYALIWTPDGFGKNYLVALNCTPRYDPRRKFLS